MAASSTAPSRTAAFAQALRRPRRASLSSPTQPDCILRIVAGRHRGAMARLHQAASLGSSDDNDVVLKDLEIRPQHAELRRVDGVWGLYDAVSGRRVPHFQSQRRGRFIRHRLALGTAQLVISQPMPTPAHRRRTSRRWQRHSRQLLGWTLLVLSLSLIAATSVQLARPAMASNTPQTRTLGREGWPDVELVTRANEPPMVQGYVTDTASLTRLQQWLQRNEYESAQLKVRVGTELANRVREALAAPQLQVSYIGSGQIRVFGQTDSQAVRERLKRLSADLAGSARLDDQVMYAVPPPPAPRPHVLPVTIVDVRPDDGALPGSFSTESGARYFVGAVLPDGSEVTAIHHDAIEFQLRGQRIHYPLN